MRFRSAALVLAYTASAALTSPMDVSGPPGHSSDYIELFRTPASRPSDSGSLVYYGPQYEANDTTTSAQPLDTTESLGARSDCPTHRRPKCDDHNGAVDNLHKSDLAPYVERMIAVCSQDRISAKTYDVNVGGACTDACLSRRPRDC
jgi:hypothetical protein